MSGQALEIAERTLGANHLSTAIFHENLEGLRSRIQNQSGDED